MMSGSAGQSDGATTERLERVVDLVEIAGKMKASTVVVVGGYRADDLRLVESARDHGIVDRILLVGPKDRIDQAVAEVGISIDPADIVPADDDVQTARAAVALIQAGGLDIVLKGGISTPVINRHMLPLAVRPTVSLATVFDSPCVAAGRPIVLTDAGVTTVCSFGRLVDMIHNAVDVAQTVMGIDRPRVAVLSANEKQIPSLPSTWIGLELGRRTWPNAVVCGPLSFDLAVDPESVSIKGLPDLPHAAEVAGQADILICPGIDTANALYKLISALNKYGEASLASITMGFPVPYIILSRADSLETRLVSIALCAVYSQRKGQGRPSAPSCGADPAPAWRVLVVHPGSTWVQVALYQGNRCLQESSIAQESAADGQRAPRETRVRELARRVCDLLTQWGPAGIDAVAAEGRLAVQASGMPLDGEDAGGLGAALASDLAGRLGARALVVDPLGAGRGERPGEGPPVGHPPACALSLLAAARQAGQETARPWEDLALVVAYLGEEITVAAVRNGRIVDHSSLPPAGRSLADGTRARLAAEDLDYQVAKEIGRMFVACGCDVEAIVLSGPLGGSDWVRTALRRRVLRLAPVIVMEQLQEMAALAAGALEALCGRVLPLGQPSAPVAPDSRRPSR
jgi:phosphotransacetylase/butyrate kinase